MMDYRIYFRFIQFSLGLYEGKEFLDGSVLQGFDWDAFYDFAKRQTLVGIVFDGIQRLPKGAAPRLDLLMKWLGMSQRVKMRNEVLNEATVAVYNSVRNAGYSCCILKGQGNAVMYPNPSARMPGDVDVWVDAGRDDIRRLARALVEIADGRVGSESLNHIGLTMGGITVELHSTPGFMANCIYNRRLQNWLRRNADLQCSNMVALPNGSGAVAVPTCAFNAVYQLYHLYHHYFYEGVGLRQVVDYYFVVVKSEERRVKGEEGEVKSEELRVKNPMALEGELNRLGLWKFAGAVMYVLHNVMGLPEDMMIAPMDRKRGRMLLDDILNGGNFGHYDKHHAVGHNLLRLYRDARLLRFYPSEALSEPVFRAWHWWWRKRNGL
ncbi:MAG: nucleotidyltransferase family protein [Prevotella sp.]|nr:nucleotidyltransferase family protein [Prevotella sp.]